LFLIITIDFNYQLLYALFFNKIKLLKKENIMLNTIQSAAPYVSTACYACAGAIALKTFGMAAGCKIGGIVARSLGNDTEEWDKSSALYWKSAKKHVVRDFTAAGFLAAGMTLGYIEKGNLENVIETAKKSDFPYFYFLSGSLIYLAITMPIAYYKPTYDANHPNATTFEFLWQCCSG
jgi:hypothetical protein